MSNSGSITPFNRSSTSKLETDYLLNFKSTPSLHSHQPGLYNSEQRHIINSGFFLFRGCDPTISEKMQKQTCISTVNRAVFTYEQGPCLDVQTFTVATVPIDIYDSKYSEGKKHTKSTNPSLPNT